MSISKFNLFVACIIFLILLTVFVFFSILSISVKNIVVLFLSIFSLIMTVQGIFTLVWMLYAWEDPALAKSHRSPVKFFTPKYTFTALIPARHEEDVISETIEAVSKIDYPEDMKEVIVICRADDTNTIKHVNKILKNTSIKNTKLIIFDGFPINKPHALNIGLNHSKNSVITIFDAEDEPHPKIYNIINTVMQKKDADVIQSGVQLMNFQSNWFSSLSVLEYFFWFKSALHYFSGFGVTPLGGNTVFIKKKWLQLIGGWDENCLTEDADVGIRLSVSGAKIEIIYDEQHVTKEETPPDTMSFIRQRTRWNQGFIQILLKGDWRNLPKLSQQLIVVYILGWTVAESFLFIYIPVSLVMTFAFKLPVFVVLLSIIPALIFVLQMIVLNIGLYEFTKDFKLKYSVYYIFKLTMVFIPFQFALLFSASRAIIRMFTQNNNWEKTTHVNAHRIAVKV